jgi:hypothetical protein
MSNYKENKFTVGPSKIRPLTLFLDAHFPGELPDGWMGEIDCLNG